MHSSAGAECAAFLFASFFFAPRALKEKAEIKFIPYDIGLYKRIANAELIQQVFGAAFSKKLPGAKGRALSRSSQGAKTRIRKNAQLRRS